MNRYLKLGIGLVLNFSLFANPIFANLPPINFEPVEFVPWEPISNHASSGWDLQSGTAYISGAGGGYGGGHGLTLSQSPQEAWLRREVNWDPNEKTAFIDFQIKPAAEPDGSLANIVANGSQIAFQVPHSGNTGKLWVLHGGDGANGTTQWYVTPGTFTVEPGYSVSSTWTRVTLRQDYDRNLWDLFIDGKLAAVNLSFEGRGANLEFLEFFGSRHGDTLLDDLSVQTGNMLFPDADKDGLPDAWETANGSNPNLYDREASKPGTSGSFLDDYLNSLWPSGNSSPGGTIPPLTIMGDHQPVGSVSGSFSVGGDGSSSYSIPIDIPKGTSGMEPRISLGYSSGAGNGIVGLGWGINGLQRITRGPASAAKDGTYDAVDFDEHDRFFLDGERLICVSGIYGAPGSEYRTELDSFARITAAGAGPSSWKVETKAGVIVYLGETADSKQQVTQGILSWGVNKVSDTAGNYYTVEYTRDPASGQPFDFINDRVAGIHYTGNTNTALTPYCHVVFDYEERPDASRAYTKYAGYKISKRLSKIRVLTDGFVNHSYRFSYATSYQTGRSLLASARKFANDDNTKGIPPTTFAYDGLAANEPVWVQQPSLIPAMDLYTYNDGDDQDVIISNRGTLAVTSGGQEISLSGESARAIPLPGGIQMYADSVLTFEFKSENLSSIGAIGFGDTLYGGGGEPLAVVWGSNAGHRSYLGYGNSFQYTQAGVWQRITMPLPYFSSFSLSQLTLACIDDLAKAQPLPNASFRDVRIYRSGSQQPTDVNPVQFQSSLTDAGFPVDRNTVFIDLNSDGLVDCCRYLVNAYPRDNTTGKLNPKVTGQVYRNTGSTFVYDSSLNPPANLALGATGNEAISYENKHPLTAKAVDINGDGRVDLAGPDAIYYLSNSLINGLEFRTYTGGSWQLLGGYTLPFKIKNLPSTGYGGDARTHHQEWMDIDNDGYTDLLIATTAKGQLVDPLNTSTVLMGANLSTIWLNKVHLGQGWVRNDAIGMPVPLMEGYPTKKDLGRRTFDLDGDGRIELVEATSNASNASNVRKSYRLTTAANGLPGGWNGSAVAVPPAWPWDLPVVNNSREANASFIELSGTGKDMGTRTVDLNGDGLPDLIRATVQSSQLLRTIYLNGGGRTAAPWTAEAKPSATVLQEKTYDFPLPAAFYSGSTLYPNGIDFTDLNGDGLPDLMYAHNSSGYPNTTYLNTGDGWKSAGSFVMPSGNYFYNSNSDSQNGNRRALLQDINGDGFPDLVTGVLDTIPKVWINQCRPEVLKSVTDGFGSEIQAEYRRLNDPLPVAAFGSRVYEKNEGTLPAGQSAVIDGRLVVSRYSEPDGMGGRRYKSQRYGDLRSDRINETSLGFGWIETLDEMNGQRSRTEMMRSYPFAGSPSKVESFVYVSEDDIGQSMLYPGVTEGLKLVTRETAEYAELSSQSGIGGTIRRPVQTKAEKWTYDLNGDLETPGKLKIKTTTLQNLEDYDAYGFVTKSTVASLNGSTVVTESVFTHVVDANRWHLGRLGQSTVTKDDGPGGLVPSVKVAVFEYSPSTGLLQSETVEPSSALSMTKSYSRDGFGNVTTTTIAASGEFRTASTVFDARGRFVTGETNALGHATLNGFDQDRALLLFTTDIAGKTIRFYYDEFGTLIRTDHPGGTQAAEITGFANNSSLPPAVSTAIGSHQIKYFRSKETSGAPVTTVYMDAMGRELVTETTILRDANASGAARYSKVYGVTLYDVRGRKIAASLPFAADETPLYAYFTYDFLDRTLITIHPDGGFDQAAGYNTVDLVTYGLPNQPATYSHAINRNGMILERWEDQHGRLIQSKDPSNTITTFHYDHEGRLVKVMNNGVPLLTNTYDIRGNKTAVWEPNSGTSTSTFNGFGEILSSTDGNGSVTSFTYDVLGRKNSVQRPEGTYYTYYDNARGSGLGQLWKVTGPSGYVEEISYDALGRPASARKTQFGETFVTATTYDGLGRTATSTDAGGLVTQHGYDPLYSFPVSLTLAGGIPGAVIYGAGTVLWHAGTFDSSGRPLTQTLAQGVETTTDYNSANGQIEALGATHGGATIQNKVYSWDGNGNLTWRQDLIAQKTEAFGYDGLNRLVASQRGGGSPVESYSYNTKGNLLSKSGATLQYSGARPHAVSSATIKGQTRTYSYDNAGNVIGDTKRAFTWTSFGQLATVAYAGAPSLAGLDGSTIRSGGDVFISFDFEAGGSRARQTKTRTHPDSSAVRETTLYLGSYERELHEAKSAVGNWGPTKVVHRHALGSVIYTRSDSISGTEVKLTTLLKDSLGSTDVLLTGSWNGSAFINPVVERQAFDPWGERRNASTWGAGRGSDADPFLTSTQGYDRGYTGHEQLDDSGLVHMNGRIYDPELGRMLSPDPYVQVPEYSQNFNRYSYVMNNPLNTTDPSGFSWLSKAFHKLKSWIKENWRTIVAIVVVIVAWYVAPYVLAYMGAPASITGAGGVAVSAAGYAAQGAVAGAISGAANAALSGGDMGDILRGALVGGVTGAMTGGLKGINGYAGIIGRGVVGGIRNVAMGGKFQDGFIPALATAAVGPVPLDSSDGVIQIVSKTAIAGVIGGTASSLGGNKFANGAWTSAFQFLIAPSNGRLGAFNGIANGLNGLISARSWGQFGTSLFSLLGLPSDIASRWTASSSGGLVPASAQECIDTASKHEVIYNKDHENVNGHHGWHAGTNAVAGFRYGVGLGSIIQFALGVAHETVDFDEKAMPWEFKNQGPLNMAMDGFADIIANTYGMLVGFSSLTEAGALRFSITTGNWIPGPTDSDKNFNGDGSTYAQRGRNPMKAWGQNPGTKEFW